MNGADTGKRLGVTVAGLSILAIAAKDPHGRAIGPCHGLPTSGPRLKLRRDGLLLEQPFGPDLISENGRKVITRARGLG